MSGIFGANRCEICEMTSCINAWFFIVLRAFMMLFQWLATEIGCVVSSKDVPNDCGLYDVFPVLVNSLQNVRRLSFDLSLDG